jgi:hypothetical protein
MAGYRGTYTGQAGIHFGDLPGWLLQGMIGGVIAGALFAAFEMLAELAIVGTADAFWMPLRMIGAIGIGPEALDPTYSLVEAGVVGLGIHIVLSAAFGTIFGGVLYALWSAARHPATLFLAAAAGGLLLWLINFYVIAPAAGWDWFPDGTRDWSQAAGHILFGLLVAAYLSWAPKRMHS